MEFSIAIWVPTFLALLWATVLYWFLTKNFKYWKRRGIPYAPAMPIVGSMGPVFTKISHEVEVQRYKKYGKIYGHYESQKPVLNIAEPNLLQNILVKDFHKFVNRRSFTSGIPIMDKMITGLVNEDWKRVRTIITPAFSTGKIKKMTDIILISARSLAKQIMQFAESKKTFDAKRNYESFSMDVIASAAFGTKIDIYQDSNNEFVLSARKLFNRDVTWRFVGFFLFPKLMKFFRIPIIPPDSINFFKTAILEIIKDRRKSKYVYNDFLKLLMDAADESVEKSKEVYDETEDEESAINDFGHEEGNEEVFKQSSHYKSLSHDELIGQCILFLLAGFESPANTLAFASYQLALNPHLQEKLIEEVDNVIKDNGNKLTYEAVQNMKYLDKVIWEVLRMYPPAIRLERLAEDDYELGAYNFTIPKGMMVGVPIYAMHYDPEFFPDPEKFNPERFSHEESSRRQKYSYLPFGAGPRNCLGLRFALMEIKICLAFMMSQYRFKKSLKTKVPLDFYAGQGFTQPKEVLLDVEFRKDNLFRIVD